MLGAMTRRRPPASKRPIFRARRKRSGGGSPAVPPPQGAIVPALKGVPPAPSAAKALVGVVMGSRSDWETMRHASEMLDQLGVPHECLVVSAHRTPDWLFEYAATAEARGIKVIIAGAGGAAHLPGMVASKTTLPVLGVPVESQSLKGLDSLLSIVQMPGGVPVGALAIGKSGAVNAGLLSAAIVGLGTDRQSRDIARRVKDFRAKQTQGVMDNRDPRKGDAKA